MILELDFNPLWFARSYAQARQGFLAACQKAGASVDSHLLRGYRDTDGAPLYADVARLGSENAAHILFVVSGTHGVEGFCGSGCQIGLLERFSRRPPGNNTAVVLVHALNPYGFAHLRRVNEENVDPNRNFVAFPDSPVNEKYEAIHEILMDTDWDGESSVESDPDFQDFLSRHGRVCVQDWLIAGQYSQPDGLFYGGTEPSWSRRVLEAVVAEHARQSARVVYVDIHTGAGPYGQGQLILYGGDDSQLRRAHDWFGDMVVSEYNEASVAPPATGETYLAFLQPSVVIDELTPMCLEFGTYDTFRVISELRAEHWHHMDSAVDSEPRKRAGSRLMSTFYPESDEWKRAVFQQFMNSIHVVLDKLQHGREAGLSAGKMRRRK